MIEKKKNLNENIKKYVHEKIFELKIKKFVQKGSKIHKKIKITDIIKYSYQTDYQIPASLQT